MTNCFVISANGQTMVTYNTALALTTMISRPSMREIALFPTYKASVVDINKNDTATSSGCTSRQPSSSSTKSTTKSKFAPATGVKSTTCVIKANEEAGRDTVSYPILDRVSHMAVGAERAPSNRLPKQEFVSGCEYRNAHGGDIDGACKCRGKHVKFPDTKFLPHRSTDGQEQWVPARAPSPAPYLTRVEYMNRNWALRYQEICQNSVIANETIVQWDDEVRIERYGAKPAEEILFIKRFMNKRQMPMKHQDERFNIEKEQAASKEAMLKHIQWEIDTYGCTLERLEFEDFGWDHDEHLIYELRRKRADIKNTSHTPVFKLRDARAELVEKLKAANINTTTTRPTHPLRTNKFADDHKTKRCIIATNVQEMKIKEETKEQVEAFDAKPAGPAQRSRRIRISRAKRKRELLRQTDAIIGSRDAGSAKRIHQRQHRGQQKHPVSGANVPLGPRPEARSTPEGGKAEL
ncbi:uncharacterized protein BCR38DRAFT_448350 [Pseudomassariella vexata]|uniref:Uncharacterized protein n=1 Tax=Pseudomassariella vexata TaxID=1141098 RepID=A0A1Y2DHH0_9PEZI|nr:uncharacterized protein BCR38DRAFT_448350 [Pseudomassariella vexata]ORY58195.1 hypothetical protein BCR38DRAFT_448350 [Pseudomassariella vexata]